MSNLQFFQGFSLIDITATGVIRGTDLNNELERNQQRNWETVIQCMGLRTQPQNIQDPISTTTDLENLEFGDMYNGEQKVWIWTWSTEGLDVYDLTNKPLGAIQQDFEQVPVITGLTETARFMLPIFYPYGSIKNIYFKQINTNSD